MDTNNRNILLFISTVLTILFLSCSEKGSSDTKVPSADSAVVEEEEHTEGIELTDEQMKAVGIELGSIQLKNLSQVVKASGQLAVPPQRRADVNVLVGGIITRIYPLEGQWVRKGQPLATLENTDLAGIQEEYLTAKNTFVFTAAELQRQKELDEANAGTKKKLQEAQANYNAELSRISTIEKRLSQFGINPSSVARGNVITQISVYAPISGTVGHIGINTGTFAEPGKPLMEIIDNSQIHCDLVVFEKDLFRVKIGQKVAFMLTNQNNREIVGRIYGINKSFEDESKGIIVHAVIENANTYGLIPGMYVTALISVGSQQVTAVPVDAVVRSEGKSFIFVVDESPEEHHDEHAKDEQKEEKKKDEEKEHAEENNTHFKMVEVVTGVSEQGYIAVTTLEPGLKNPKVVVKGSFYILSKAKGGASHDH